MTSEDTEGAAEQEPQSAEEIIILDEESADSAAGADQAPAAGAAQEESSQPDETTKERDWETVASERTADLQRLQAEYVNYKKRVDRDRLLSRQSGVEAVVIDLMPVLDSIRLAREHGDLDGGFKLVAEELEKLATKHGLVAFGEVGEEFDPNLHDALMEVPMEKQVEVVTISQVMQQGYSLKDRVIRPARVGVANP